MRYLLPLLGDLTDCPVVSLDHIVPLALRLQQLLLTLLNQL